VNPGSTSPPEAWQFITNEQLAAWLGNRSIHTIRRWRKAGTGPVGHKIGRRVLYLVADVQTWLDEQADD